MMDLKNIASIMLGAHIIGCSSCSNKVLAKPSNILTDDRKVNAIGYRKSGPAVLAYLNI